jgi:hypothetical protein
VRASWEKSYLGCRRLSDDGETSRVDQALRLAVVVEIALARLAPRHVGCLGHVRVVSHT